MATEPKSLGAPSADGLTTQLRRLERVAALVASREPGAVIFEALLRELGESVGAELNSIHLLSPSTDRPTTVARGVSAEFASFVASTIPPGDANDLRIVRDTRENKAWSATLILSEQNGIRSAWSVPIVSTSGGLLGSIVTYHRQPSEPDSTDVDIARVYARCAAIAIENAILSEQIDRSRTELK